MFNSTVDRLHFRDASVGSENHGERNVHRSHVDLGVVEVSLVSVVKFRVHTVDRLGLRQRNVLASCQILTVVNAVVSPVEVHRRDNHRQSSFRMEIPSLPLDCRFRGRSND